MYTIEHGWSLGSGRLFVSNNDDATLRSANIDHVAVAGAAAACPGTPPKRDISIASLLLRHLCDFIAHLNELLLSLRFLLVISNDIAMARQGDETHIG